MGKRLVTVRQIHDEKLPWGRSTVLKRVKEGTFPAPVISGGPGPNLWDEADVDAFVANFVAKAKEAAARGEQTTAKATAARASARSANAAA
jgi:predicted DNA-binding transcriptional regulator AlpA